MMEERVKEEKIKGTCRKGEEGRLMKGRRKGLVEKKKKWMSNMIRFRSGGVLLIRNLITRQITLDDLTQLLMK